jgi:hypothetical protein
VRFGDWYGLWKSESGRDEEPALSEAFAAGRLEGIRAAIAALPTPIKVTDVLDHELLRTMQIAKNERTAEIRAALTAKLEAGLL